MIEPFFPFFFRQLCLYISDSLHLFTLFLTDSLEKCQTKSFANEYSTFCNFQILYHKSAIRLYKLAGKTESTPEITLNLTLSLEDNIWQFFRKKLKFNQRAVPIVMDVTKFLAEKGKAEPRIKIEISFTELDYPANYCLHYLTKRGIYV